MKPVRKILLALFALIAGGAVGAMVYFYILKDDALSPSHPEPQAALPLDKTPLPTDLPVVWHARPTTHTVAILPQEKGLTAKLDDGQELALTLTNARLEPISWRHATREHRTTLTGSTLIAGVPLEFRWHFDAHDPQISLTVEMRDVPVSALGQPVFLQMTLPEGTYRASTHEMQLAPISETTTFDAWTPGWLQLQSGPHTLTLSNWDFDAVTLAPASHTLTLVIWDPGAHPPVYDCEDYEDRTVTISRHVTFTLGDRLGLLASRYHEGFRAAIAPLFLDPATHHAKTNKDARAEDASDWVARARTLLYGHSDEKDPRFGNGGLLGFGLGGDLAIEPGWEQDPAVLALAKQLQGTHATLLARELPADKDSPLGTLLTKESCAPFFERSSPYLLLGDARPLDQLDLLRYRPDLVVDRQHTTRPMAGFAPPHASYLEIPQTEGKRVDFVDQLFTPTTLQQLITQRALVAFAAPLIATRNPLTPSATEALIEPERNGAWTLSEPVTRALAQAELINEAHQLLVTSPTQLIAYWERAREVQITELPDGSFAIINPFETPIAHFTLIAPGNVSPKLVKGELESLDVVTTSQGGSQTWFWWTLEPGITHLKLSEDQAQGALQPTHWQIKEPPRSTPPEP